MRLFYNLDQIIHSLCERLSAGTAGAGVSAETGSRVKVAESIADKAAPAVDQPRLVRPWFPCVRRSHVCEVVFALERR